jgi:heme/copper-type cytochrome/quinol oxidase subunit 3
MFFVAWFWAYFSTALFPADIHHVARTELLGGVWPPKGIETFDPWHLPLLNTLILLTSGTTVTWAHHALLHNDRQGLKWGLICTIALGLTFTGVQAYEYMHAAFNYAGHIYGATFFMATGFHGAHVIIGSIFLIVCLARAYAGQFTPKQHLGFEFAAWYWHFVDVVWLFLFACIYVWGAARITRRPRSAGTERCAYRLRGGRAPPLFLLRSPDSGDREHAMDQPSLPQSIATGLAGRCPRCRKGALFSGFPQFAQGMPRSAASIIRSPTPATGRRSS